MKFDIQNSEKCIIKVIGVGGGGGNAVKHMFLQGITGVDFAICNTDAQAMESSPVLTKIPLGPNLTEGRGAGSMPEVGKQSCIESIEEIRRWLSDGTKMLFITAGMGGGTGTGAAPIIAKVAKDMGILTVAIVTLPFKFEGLRRQKQGLEGLDQLKKNVDSILVISNDKLSEIYDNLPFTAAFGKADDILTTAAKGIAEIITVPGIINVDFEDVNTVMRNSGVAIMGNAYADGEDRARKAIHNALNSPLLEDNDIRGAQHILLNITSGAREITMAEIREITDYVQEEAGYGTDLIWGNCKDESLGDNILVTLIATGFQEGSSKSAVKPSKVEDVNVKTVRVPLDKEFPFTEDDTEEIYEDETASNTIEFETPAIPQTPYVFDRIVSNSASNKVTDPSNENQDKPKGDQIHREAEAARREYLRNTNSKPLDNPKIIADLESRPAYERRKVVLDEEVSSSNKRSNYSLNMDEDGTLLFSNNSYLYDNVD